MESNDKEGGSVREGTNEKNKEINDYPIVLSAKHLMEILDIGKRKAYELMDEEGFPLVRIGTKTKRVARDDFFKWLSDQKKKRI
jgi:hypothetical protein